MQCRSPQSQCILRSASPKWNCFLRLCTRLHRPLISRFCSTWYCSEGMTINCNTNFHHAKYILLLDVATSSGMATTSCSSNLYMCKFLKVLWLVQNLPTCLTACYTAMYSHKILWMDLKIIVHINTKLVLYLNFGSYIKIVNVLFPHLFSQLHFVSSASGFYFVYDFCLYGNMSALVSYTFRYLPLCVVLLLCPLVVLLRCVRSLPCAFLS